MIIMTWKDIVKEEDILRMIDNLESKAFSYSLDEKEFKKAKDAFDMLRAMFKDYRVKQTKSPIEDKDTRFSDE